MGGHSLSSSSSLMCGSLYAQVAQGPFQTHLILASSIVRKPVAGSANSIYRTFFTVRTVASSTSKTFAFFERHPSHFRLRERLAQQFEFCVQHSLTLLWYTAKCPQVVSTGVHKKSKTSSAAKFRSQWDVMAHVYLDLPPLGQSPGRSGLRGGHIEP